MTVYYHPTAKLTEPTGSRPGIIIALALVLIVALWMRAPFISAGMPFFYHEDEAHHWNRTVGMVQAGTFDPQYFHKPSLHFYLRMPIVAASFLWNVRKEHLRSIHEVQTRDPFGVAGYSFSASHPGMVKWNRAFSVVLSLGALIFITLITFRLTGSSIASGAAGLAAALSPDLVAGSAVIGVDVVMTFMVIICVWLSLKAADDFGLGRLFWCALFAGLAVSSKYNALPIVLVPCVVVAARAGLRPSAWGTIAGAVIAGFIVGTPFALSSLPLFLDHVAYEVWHYGVAAHEGNSAEPGWPQAAFYLNWMTSSALGPVLVVLALFGLIGSIVRPRLEVILTALFPLAFALLMVSQRTNFTRNMHAILPFAGVFAVLAYLQIIGWLKLKGVTRGIVHFVFIIAAFWYPASEALHERAEARERTDSRAILLQRLMEHPRERETAISGQLQMPVSVYAAGTFSRFDQNERVLQQYLKGFDAVITGPHPPLSSEDRAILELETTIPGVKRQQRIVDNPEISVWRFRPDIARAHAERFLQSSDEPAIDCASESGCAPRNSGEEHAWMQSRFAKILLPKSVTGAYRIQVMSPWNDQKIRFFKDGFVKTFSLNPGAWEEIRLSLPAPQDFLMVEVENVRSPKKAGLSADTRRLGAAFRQITGER